VDTLTKQPMSCRFVDRDMVMRFIGGVGHSVHYNDGGLSAIIDAAQSEDEDGLEPDLEPEVPVPLERRSSRAQGLAGDSDGSQGDTDGDSDEESEVSESDGGDASGDDAGDNEDVNISDDGYGSPG
jgi:hypothetical protein